ncbi:3-deoxy-7-phosphoheptulonate synthase class II, partial [Glycomyces sp. NPDC048151]
MSNRGLAPTVIDAEEAERYQLDAWRNLPREQVPPWDDYAEVEEVTGVLAAVPPIVAPYEV